MNSRTRSRIDALSARPVTTTVCQSVATAPRRASRLDGAIVVVKPSAPVPSAPAAKGRSRSAASVPVAAAKPAAPKVVRIKCDPAVAAAEAERRAQARAAAQAEEARVAEEARRVAEAQAEEARVAEEARMAAEAAERQRRDLVAARAEFLNFVALADDEAFPYAWMTARREWIVEKAANASIEWIRDRRSELETGIARLLQSLAPFRASLLERLEGASPEVVSEMNNRQSWRSKETWIALARDAKSKRHLDLIIDREQQAAANVAERVAEAEVKAEAERERLAKPAGADAAKTIANALGQKQGPGGTQVSASASGKTPKADVVERRGLGAGAVRVPVPVGCRPSKAQMADLERELNGGKQVGTGVQYFTDPARTLNDRILALSPVTVARIHAERPVPHTWPTIDRILNAVRGAKDKVDGRVIDDGKALERIQTFVAWCERG